MLTYCYDGTPEGLFSAFEAAFVNGEQPDEFQCVSGGGGLDLFSRTVEISTNPDMATAFGRRLRAVDKQLPGELIRAFLSEQAGVELCMFKYVRLIFQYGGGVRGNLTDPVISRMQKLLRKVGSELHRLKGLLRFEELEDGLLWANYEPAFNISVLLIPHFSERLKNYRWVICDVARGIAIYYDGHTAQPVELNPGVLASLKNRGQLPGRTAHSDVYTDLWRTFFKSVAIQERINPALQRQFMPKRFWKWLPEKTNH